MIFAWLSWSNPVAVWWCFLLAVSVINIALWLKLSSFYRHNRSSRDASVFGAEPLLLLSAAYVFGCAFRSVLPRADVQRICLFDTWLSSVLVGRSVATVAEICFVAQWAIILRALGRMTHSDTVRNISGMIVPLILLAEFCSWSAVITTDFLGNVIENSLWTAAFVLIEIALLRLLASFHGLVHRAILAAALGVVGYIVFMATIDVPLYFGRWQAQLADGGEFLGPVSGLYDLATRWVVTHKIALWQGEIPWMSLYFSLAVWTSLALACFGLVKHAVPRYRVRTPLRLPTRRPVPVPVRHR